MKNTLLLTIFLFSPPLLAGETQLAQLFNEYCVSCHGTKKQEGDVKLNRVDERFISNRELLETLVGVLEEKEMPPREQKQPPAELRTAVVKTLKRELHDQAVPSLLKRLTREEYTNTINDLFGTEFDLTELLPEDSNEDGFNKLGESHLMSPHQVQSYLITARFLADRLVLDERPDEREWVFGRKHFHGSGRGDYQTPEAHVLSTNYPWRSNLHFSTSPEAYELFVIPQFGRYRFEAEVTIANSESDQTVGVTLGDPRYPTNFKKIARLLLPNDATSFSIDLTLRKGSQVSFTFDSASTWHVGQKPENYKGAKLFFTKVTVTGPIYEPWPTAAERRILPKTADDAAGLTDHLVTLLTHRSLPAADMAEFTQLAQ